VVPLRNLRPDESRADLHARGVPADRHPAALAFTHGHPLALSLVADVSASGGDPTAFTPEQRPAWSGPCWSGSWSACPAPATARPSRPAPTSG
jgi:hypothetical protein